MKKLFILILFIQTSIIAQNSQKNFIDQNYIKVTGTIESEITPDEIYLNITINEKDKKGKVSVEIQEAKMIQQLKITGIDIDKNLSILNFNSAFNSFLFRKDNVLKIKQYSLLVNDTQTLTKVFKIFDALEISNVNINKVDHSKMEELKLEAKVKAIKIAKKKAKAYAEAINQSIGNALLITENNNQNYLSNGNAIYGANASNIIIRGYSSHSSKNRQIENKINFKKIIIIASVEANFELK